MTKMKIKKVKKSESAERERVMYNFDAKRFAVLCSTTFNKHIFVIAKQHIIALTKLLNDREQFYAYCNKTLKLLRVLECDALAKKNKQVINTQYDSRKKLMKVIEHIAMSVLKQKSKSKRASKKSN